MRSSSLGLALVAFAVACGSSDNSMQYTLATSVGDLVVADAYAPAPAAPDVGSLYFTVINQGSQPETLLVVETSAGGTASLHEMTHVDGAMRMSPTGPFSIAPSDTLRMAPGGYHVMIEQISSRPVVGDTLDVALTFSHTGRIELRVPVLTYTEVARLLEGPGDHDH